METQLQQGNISLILEGYVDIFSSFDPRPYDQRALSDDFLDECEKILHDKKFPIVEIRLLVPDAKRSLADEEVIEKRLHLHFLEQARQVRSERKKEMIYGILFIVGGLLLGIIITLIMQKWLLPSFGMTLLTLMGEPASWFCIWTGSDMLLRLFRTTHLQYIMMQKLHHAKIHFYGY